jgi:hypothetical protein
MVLSQDEEQEGGGLDQQVPINGLLYNDTNQVFLIAPDGLEELARLLRAEVAEGREVWVRGPRREWESLLLIAPGKGDEVLIDVAPSRPGMLSIPLAKVEPLAARLEKLLLPVHLTSSVRFDVRHKEKRCALASGRVLRLLQESGQIEVALEDLPIVYERVLAEINEAVHRGTPEVALMNALFECDEVEEVYAADEEIRLLFNKEWKALKEQQKSSSDEADPHGDHMAFVVLDPSPVTADTVADLLVEELAMDREEAATLAAPRPAVIAEHEGQEPRPELTGLREKLELLGSSVWYGRMTSLAWK